MTEEFNLNNNITFDLTQIGNWIFKDGEKEYKFDKKEFIKRFCLKEIN